MPSDSITLTFTEGALTLPRSYCDESMNVFRFDSGITLIVTRAQLQPDTSVDKYINEQIKELKKGVKNFQVGARTPFTLIEGYEGELVISYCTKGKELVNNQMIVVAHSSTLLVLTFSKAGDFNEQDAEFIHAILSSFTPSFVLSDSVK
ncbi:DcrB-related protein [Thorsellia anophelis]|uniref:DUF1795 domain-containing protein n=1 Tax=Thorsellia anophelis DSM 18579 TaxID=1123402 RepID=A0A1I0FLM0_9GAMM|nr:DcrB-related protein [Thorsellia anophelis]SET59268.1 hypothetical protein SAMN02583745_02812 [Thorsellia anophelis DSM 18579]